MKAFSVPCLRATRYCSGLSWAFHSASVLVILTRGMLVVDADAGTAVAAGACGAGGTAGVTFDSLHPPTERASAVSRAPIWAVACWFIGCAGHEFEQRGFFLRTFDKVQ